MTLPQRARIVVVGGGAMGAGALYHLAQEGWIHGVTVEKAEVTSGSTWHAAGRAHERPGSREGWTCWSWSTAGPHGSWRRRPTIPRISD